METDDDRRDDLKERVIHTRISEALDEEIRKKATGLGLSVSNLVRNILLNTFGLVEDIMADSADIAHTAGRKRAQRGGARNDSATVEKESAAPVIGWQSFVLSRNAVCDQCNAILAKGSQAAAAVRDGAGPRTIICPRCLEEVTHDDATDDPAV